MRREYPPTTPNEEAGKKWASNLPAGIAEIGLDDEVLRTFAGEWQIVANKLRLQAAEVATVGGQAVSEAGGFVSEYETDGAYDGDYESMTTGDTAVAQKLTEAADHAEKIAGAAAWTADNWEQVQAEAAARVEDIESDITVGTDAAAANVYSI